MTGQRIAVLGNSHAASMKNAWDSVDGAVPGIASLSIFARPNGYGGMNGLRAEGAVIVVEDEELRGWFVKTGGSDRLDTREHDVFLVHAFGPDSMMIYNAAQSLARHRYSGALMDVILKDFRRAVATAVLSMPQAALCRLLRGATDAPVFATHKPLYALQYAEDPDSLEHGALLYANYLEAMTATLAGIGCRLLAQPPETVVSRCFTDDRYAKKDLQHMNQAYGLLVLKSLVSALAEAPR